VKPEGLSQHQKEKRTMKKLLLLLWALFMAVTIGVYSTQGGSSVPVEDADTNIVGVVTANSTNLQDVCPIPSGVIAFDRRIYVQSGTLTFLGSAGGSTTNLLTAGATTNLYCYGGTITFASGDGWIQGPVMPTRDGTKWNGYCAGTIGDGSVTATTGMRTGTVNTATVWYWIIGRKVFAPSTAGGTGSHF